MNSLDDWYQVTNQDIIIYGGNGLILEYGTLSNILPFVFPSNNVKSLYFFILIDYLVENMEICICTNRILEEQRKSTSIL